MATGNNRITTRCEFVDPAIDRISADKTQLTLFHYGEGLCFSLLNRELNKIVLLADYLLPQSAGAVGEVLQQFTQTFAGYHIIWHSPAQGFIPESLFDPTQQISLGEKLLGIPDAAITQMPAIQSVLLHNPMPAYLEAVRFPKARFHPDSYCAVQSVATGWKHRPGQNIQVQVWEKYLSITAFANGKLSVHNHFATQSDEDRLYYILFAYEQLKQNPEEVPLNINGFIEEGGALWKKLQEYIREVKMRESTEHFSFSTAIPNEMIRRYLPVFESFSCE